MTTTATVEKVDTKKRQMTLRDDQGNKFKVNVPQEVANFEQIKKGDKITIDYHSSVALALVKGEKGKPPSAEAAARMERTPGPLPGGMVARRVSATAEVVKVDKNANKLTIRTPAGEMETIDVTDPSMQAELAKLKPGDRIVATYNEAVAISVMPQEKKEQKST